MATGPDLPCADRCPKVDAAISQYARTQLEHRTARIALGLTPEYVPPTPERVTTSPVSGWLTETP